MRPLLCLLACGICLPDASACNYSRASFGGFNYQFSFAPPVQLLSAPVTYSAPPVCYSPPPQTYAAPPQQQYAAAPPPMQYAADDVPQTASYAAPPTQYAAPPVQQFAAPPVQLSYGGYSGGYSGGFNAFNTFGGYSFGGYNRGFRGFSGGLNIVVRRRIFGGVSVRVGGPSLRVRVIGRVIGRAAPARRANVNVNVRVRGRR